MHCRGFAARGARVRIPEAHRDAERTRAITHAVEIAQWIPVTAAEHGLHLGAPTIERHWSGRHELHQAVGPATPATRDAASGSRRGALAVIAYTVAVFVLLPGIRQGRTQVHGVTDAVRIAVGKRIAQTFTREA